MTAPVANAIWNPESASAYMHEAADLDQVAALDPECTVRILDKWCDLEEYAQDYIDLEFDIKRNGTGAVTMSLPADTAARDHIFNNPDGADAIIPIIIDTTGFQWTGQIDTAAIILDENGVETIEITGLHDWEWCNRIAMWPSPFAPLEVQFPKRMVGIGPAETVIKTFYWANLLRIQLPLWRVPALDKIFDPGEWFSLADATFPCAVMPVNVFTDTTKWCAVSARMQMGGELFEQVLKDSGLSLTSRLWMPDEHEQPAPGFFNLTRPTILIDIEDHSGVTGPTGTAIDGLLWWTTELLDDLVTEVLAVNPNNDSDLVMDDDLGEISKWVGLKKARPQVVWMDGEYSGIMSGEVTIHKPMARDIYVGGKSPGWVNNLIDLGMTTLLGYIGTALGVSGIAALYNGQLDDIIMAFQRFTDAGRAERAGPYIYPEHVVADSSSAYTIDGTMSGRSGVWDTRGYISKSVKVRDGDPYVFGIDYNVGNIVGYELDGTIWTDYVHQGTFTDNRKERAHWTVQIGDGSDEESNGERANRKVQSVLSMVRDAATDAGVDMGLGFI